MLTLFIAYNIHIHLFISKNVNFIPSIGTDNLTFMKVYDTQNKSIVNQSLIKNEK